MFVMSFFLAQVQQPSLAPGWVVLPLALVALLVVGAHWILLGRASGVPVVRRSLRSANGLVMMLAIPVLAYGFGIVSPSNGRAFALTWILATGLLALVLILASADLLYTAHLARKEYAELRRDLNEKQRASSSDANATDYAKP